MFLFESIFIVGRLFSYTSFLNTYLSSISLHFSFVVYRTTALIINRMQIIIIIVLYIVLIASSVSLIAFSSTLFKSYSASASITAGFLSIICSIGLIALYIWIAIKSLFYVLVYQVAYDNPNLSSKEVVEESERLMTGNRGKYFVLQLSFIGWAILACLTLGIGFLWLTPYITISTICFYEALAGKSDSPIEVDSEEVE